MKSFQTFSLQSLESRVLMSAAPHGHVKVHLHEGHHEQSITDPVFAADLAAFKADIAKYSSDESSGKTLVAADQAALKAACDKLKADMAGIMAQRMTDELTWFKTLSADRAAIDSTKATDQSVIDADNAAIANDADGSDQLASDQEKLAADQSKMAGDLTPLQTTLSNDQAAFHAVREGTGHQLYLIMQQDQPAVTAARQKLQADQQQNWQTNHDDAVQLHTDWLKCQADQAANGSTTITTTTQDTTSSTTGKHKKA